MNKFYAAIHRGGAIVAAAIALFLFAGATDSPEVYLAEKTGKAKTHKPIKKNEQKEEKKKEYPTKIVETKKEEKSDSNASATQTPDSEKKIETVDSDGRKDGEKNEEHALVCDDIEDKDEKADCLKKAELQKELPTEITPETLAKYIKAGEEELLKDHKGVKKGALLATADGKTLYAENENEAFIPASNTKAVTAAAALYYLGPTYTFKTGFYTKPKSEKESGATADMYVKAGGDPALYKENLFTIARELRHRGIIRIEGNLVFDLSMFGVCGDIKGSDFEKNDQAYRSKVCAFSSDFNVVTIYARPAKKAAQPAFIEVEPNAPNYISVKNNVKTVAKGKVKPLIISVSVSGGKMSVEARGELPVGAETKVVYRRAPDPFAFASESLKASLEAAGIKVTGKILKKALPKDAELVYQYESPPLWKIAGDFVKESNNFMTDQTLLTVAAEKLGAPATFEKSAQILTGFLKEAGIADDKIYLENGSGLTENNKLTPSANVALLRFILGRPDVYPEFITALCVAGKDGTLKRRFDSLDDNHLIRAKTGTLEGAISLSGYAMSKNGKVSIFAIYLNDCDKKKRKMCRMYVDYVANLLTKLK